MCGAWRRAVRAAAVRKPKREAEGVRANGPNGFPLSGNGVVPFEDYKHVLSRLILNTLYGIVPPHHKYITVEKRTQELSPSGVRGFC